MFCDSFRNSLKKFVKKMNNYLANNIDNALYITTMLKSFIASPACLLITDIIPGEWDNSLRFMSQLILEKALIALDLLKAESGGLTKENLIRIMEDIKKLSKDNQNAILFKLASLITAAYDQNKMTKSEYDLAVQCIYTLKNKKNG